jgi:hypothetical protein
MSRRKDLVGQKVGRLLIVKYLGYRSKISFYECLCDCGNMHVVRTPALKRGLIRSCGCLRRDCSASHTAPGGVMDRRHHVTAFGRTQTISEWSNETGQHIATITARLKRGWTPETAVSKPPQQQRRKSVLLKAEIEGRGQSGACPNKDVEPNQAR